MMNMTNATDYGQLKDAASAIASRCDGAHALDGQGYNSADTTFGKSLAVLPVEQWDQDVAAAAWSMLSHYRSQLKAMGINFNDIPRVVPVDGERYGRDKAIADAHADLQKSKISEQGWLDVEQGVVCLYAPYDPNLINDCRNIPQRSWNASKKRWEFPMTNAPAIWELAAKWNIRMESRVRNLPDSTPGPVLVQTGLVVDGDFAELRFPSSREMTASVRRVVHGVSWNDPGKCWRTPVVNLQHAIRFAQLHNLVIEDGLVEQVEREEREAAERATASRALDADIAIPRLAPGMELLPYQRAGVAYALETRRCMIADSMGLGKGLVHGTPVLTPSGWTNIESITEGSLVIGSDGTPTIVTGVYHRGVLPVYEVGFNDGTSLTVDGDHLWEVKGAGVGRASHVKETRDLMDDLMDGAGNTKWRIPVVKPVQFPHRELPVDPYVIGVLLGDGALINRVGLSSADPDILAQVESRLPGGVTPGPGKRNPLLDSVRSMGINVGSEYKFVPHSYLYADDTSRIALLRGLMDTDGYAGPDGTNEFTSVSKRLADDVAFLVQSLGGIVRRGTKELYTGKTCYRVNVKMTFCPFLVRRKVTAWKKPTKYPPARTIKSITEVGVGEVTCIKVAAPNGLFVAEHCIVTHNTVQALATVVAADALPAVVVCPNTLKLNWEMECEKFFPHLLINVVSGTQSKPIEDADIIVVNYDIVAQRADDILLLNPEALIADESHAIKNGKPIYTCPNDTCKAKLQMDSKVCGYCKNHFTTCTCYTCNQLYNEEGLRDDRLVGPIESWTIRRTEGVMKIARSIPEDGMVLLLTGTPVTNRPAELIPQLAAIGRLDEFGGRYRFQNRYAPGGTGAANLIELNKKLRERCFIRRTQKEVYTELPELRNAPQTIPVDPDKFAVYKKIEADVVEYLALRAAELAKEMGEDETAAYWEKRLKAEAAEHLVRITVLKNAVSELKYDSLVAWIETFLEDTDEKVVVFAEHIEIVERIAAKFGDAAVKIRGGVKQADRMEAVRRFQTDDSVRVFIGNMAAASEGLTLTAASNVVFCELAWTPTMHAQCASRCYARANDLHGATAWYLLAARTIDLDIYKLLQQKEIVVTAATEGKEIDKQSSILGDLIVTLAKRGLGIE